MTNAARDAMVKNPIELATWVVVDVETTGLDPHVDQVLELSATVICKNTPMPVALWTSLVCPTIPIPAEVSAIHHLTRDDVFEAPSWTEVRACFGDFIQRLRQSSPGGSIVLAGHNLPFDAPFIGLDDEPLQLCTERLAHHCWPDAPNFKNETLRYYLSLEVETFGLPSHRALGDTIVTSELLRRELDFVGAFKDIHDVDTLLAFAAAPYLVPVWSFGKHYHEPIEVADNDYIRWALEDKDDLSPDFRYTLQFLRHMRETQMKDTDNARSLFDLSDGLEQRTRRVLAENRKRMRREGVAVMTGDPALRYALPIVSIEPIYARPAVRIEPRTRSLFEEFIDGMRTSPFALLALYGGVLLAMMLAFRYAHVPWLALLGVPAGFLIVWWRRRK